MKKLIHIDELIWFILINGAINVQTLFLLKNNFNGQ